MIRILNDSRNHVIEVRGHAGGIAGQDVVCASVSCLLLTLAQRCTELHESDFRTYPAPTIVFEPGYARIAAYAKDSGKAELDAVWKTVLCGLRKIAENFAENVQMGC